VPLLLAWSDLIPRITRIVTFAGIAAFESHVCQQSYLLLFGIPSRTHSFIPGLKRTFSANPSQSIKAQPFLFLLQDLLHGFPRLFTVTSEHIRLYFLVFLFYTFSAQRCSPKSLNSLLRLWAKRLRPAPSSKTSFALLCFVATPV